MADMNKIMDELLASAPEEDESEQDTDIYYGPQHDNDSQALGENRDGERDWWDEDEDEEDENEDQWEFQQEYDEWSDEMEYIEPEYVDKVRTAQSNLEEIISFIDDEWHRYWPDEAQRIIDMIDEIHEISNRLYSRTEDYRSNPEEW